MVLNIGALKDDDLSSVFADVAALAAEVNRRQRVLKVILETGLLSHTQIIDGCVWVLFEQSSYQNGHMVQVVCVVARCQFVKTSTGFGPRGASVEDVRLMRAVVGGTTSQHQKSAQRMRTEASSCSQNSCKSRLLAGCEATKRR
jgi:deoxyribose-phosphate aldolase